MTRPPEPPQRPVPPAGAALATAVDLLIRRVGHWTPARWTAAGVAGPVHDLVQRLADLDADVEGLPRREVPRPDNDLVLPDQLRVVAADLVLAGPPDGVLAAALQEVRAVSAGLPGR